jgi:tetratricopeptide (TPR) repeat protein
VPRRFIIISVVLLVLIGATAWAAFHLWHEQERRAIALAAVPPMPDLSRWPPEFATQLRAATAAVSQREKSLGALGQLALLYHANGFSTEAKRVLETLRRLDPPNARWPYLLADSYSRMNAATETEQALQATVALDPRYAPAWLRLGDALVQRDAFDQAEACYKKAAALAGNDLRVEFALLSFAAVHGQRGDPRPRLAELARAHPEIKPLHELLAQLYAKAGDSTNAALEQRRAAAAEQYLPNRDPWLDELAFLCFDPNRLGLTAYKLSREWRLPEAEAVLQHAIRLAPGEAALRDSLCHLYELMGRLPDAQAVLEAALTACPDDIKTRVQLGRILRLEKKPDEAVAVIRHALERWPTAAELHAALGLALRDTKDIRTAAAAFREAVRLDPTLVEAQYNLGYCLLVLGEPAAARTAVEKALVMRPDYPEALLFLGSLALQARDVAAADAPVNQLYRIRPEDADAQLLFATLQLMKGGAAHEGGDWSTAAAAFRSGLAAAPEFAPLLREWGLLAFERHELGDALAAFEHYVRNEPHDPTGYLWLGKTLLALDRQASASEVFVQGLNLARKSGTPAQAAEFTRLLPAE